MLPNVQQFYQMLFFDIQQKGARYYLYLDEEFWAMLLNILTPHFRLNRKKPSSMQYCTLLQRRGTGDVMRRCRTYCVFITAIRLAIAKKRQGVEWPKSRGAGAPLELKLNNGLPSALCVATYEIAFALSAGRRYVALLANANPRSKNMQTKSSRLMSGEVSGGARLNKLQTTLARPERKINQ